MNKAEYLLTHLAEEASEVIVELGILIKAIAKAQRFGYKSISIKHPEMGTYRDILREELGDVLNLVDQLELHGVIDPINHEDRKAKSIKGQRMMDISRAAGALHE